MQLLASYLLLMATMLMAIAVALLILLNTRPAPPQATFQRLTGISQGLNLTEIFIRTNSQPNQSRIPPALMEQLDEFAMTRDVRVMIVQMRNNVSLYDSAGAIPVGSQVPLNITAQQVQVGRFNVTVPAISRIFGDFGDADGNQWLFTGVVGRRPFDTAFLLAEQRPKQSLQDSLSDFGNSLALPLLQSALVGLIIAVILAILISRGIARPLQRVAYAATAIAEGHYNQRVPVSGPPEVRIVAEAFNNMSEEVLHAQQAQKDFIANVSHDLKTPLTSIQGYSQAIIDGAAKDPTHAARIIHEEAGRLNRMVVQLTDLTRLEAGRLSMQTEPIDMGQLTAAVAQRLAIMAHEKHIALDVQANPMPEIAGDGDRLDQVLTNLISNAIKYTPDGGRVQIIAQVANGGVEVVVRDTGVGIPPEDLPRIFERFYQVDKARGPKRGTGLGLAITREIVHAHGGTINVYSEGHGKGTTFTVWLPSPHLSTIV
ncbi:MAG: HAMP domain-containing protein, partial [Chloroflexi bacterium]